MKNLPEINWPNTFTIILILFKVFLDIIKLSINKLKPGFSNTGINNILQKKQDINAIF